MSERSFDIVVVGAGAVGLCTALALSCDGFRVALVGEPDLRRDGRTVALLAGSVRLLEALGTWPAMAPDAAALATMQLVDDTGSLFRPPPVAFDAGEIGLAAFGWNVENAILVGRLAESARSAQGIVMIPSPASGCSLQADRAVVTLQAGEPIEACLVVAADGARSRLRESAAIATRTWRYPQTALTAILAHDREHRETSTEFHTRHGPFTLVPLPGRRSSLVWVTSRARAQDLADLDDTAFAAAVERQAQSMLGGMRIEGPRGAIPMTGLSVDRYIAPRLALVGEAAHVFPPIGAQGLNLGLRDGAALRDAVVDARQDGSDPGADATLEQYQRGRDLDVRLRTAAVDGLNRTLLSGLIPTDLLRGAGLLALSTIGPLRRAVMREGVSPHLGAPRLMRDTQSASPP